MAPHRILAAVPDLCGLPVVFCFPRVYHRTTWRLTRRTVVAQRLPAHDLFSLFKGAVVPLRLLPRIRNSQSTLSLCPLRSSRRRSPPRSFSPSRLAKKLRWALPRRDSPQLHRFHPECRPGNSFLFFISVHLRRISGDRRPLRPPPQVSLNASTLSSFYLPVLGPIGYLSLLFFCFFSYS